jgi:serine/threonine protein phosphatase PrpC
MPGFFANLQNFFKPPFSWHIAANSVTGAMREQNEDSVGFAQDASAGIAILADGVGGHNAGEVASRFVCEELKTWFTQRPKVLSVDEAAQQLKAAITTVHNALFKQSQQQPELAKMATTLVVLLQYQHSAVFAWAGDSRIYLLRQNSLTQLSEDHSVIEDKIRHGELTRAEAAHHPMSNLITSTLGGKPRIPQLGLKTLALEKRDSLLLVSDGISGVLSPAELQQLMPQGVDALIAAAQQADSTDDCSAVIVNVKGN